MVCYGARWGVMRGKMGCYGARWDIPYTILPQMMLHNGGHFYDTHGEQDHILLQKFKQYTLTSIYNS